MSRAVENFVPTEFDASHVYVPSYSWLFSASFITNAPFSVTSVSRRYSPFSSQRICGDGTAVAAQERIAFPPFKIVWFFGVLVNSGGPTKTSQ